MITAPSHRFQLLSPLPSPSLWLLRFGLAEAASAAPNDKRARWLLALFSEREARGCGWSESRRRPTLRGGALPDGSQVYQQSCSCHCEKLILFQISTVPHLSLFPGMEAAAAGNIHVEAHGHMDEDVLYRLLYRWVIWVQRRQVETASEGIRNCLQPAASSPSTKSQNEVKGLGSINAGCSSATVDTPAPVLL